MDPDEYLEAYGKESFASLLNKTEPLIDILWKKYTDGVDASTPERKALIEKTLIEEVNKIKDQSVRNYYMQEIKSRIYNAFRPKIQKLESFKRDDVNVSTNVSSNKAVVVEKKPLYRENYGKYERRDYNKNNNRMTIGHSFVNIDRLKNNVDSESDKNLRFIMASELIYPELIDEYEEEIFIDDIKDDNLKRLQILIADTYHESENPLSGDELCGLIKETDKKLYDELWEVNMLKNQKPFINDLRKKIGRLLLSNKVKSIENELKELGDRLKKAWSDDDYIRYNALKKDRDEILSSISENVDE